MAIRNIVREGDDVLLKKCRPVKKFNERLWQLLDDMADTLASTDGVGLAAPQVGVLRRCCVIDIGEGLHEFINPEIIETQDEQEVMEGCLSCPGEVGLIIRPKYVKAKAFDRFGNEYIIEGEDFFAQAMSHEFDHLDGILFKSKVERMLTEEEIAELTANKDEEDKEEEAE